MKRLTDKRLVLMALDSAIQWEGELLDGAGDNEDMKAASRRLIEGYRRVIKRLTGGDLTITEMAYERALAGTRTVGLEELGKNAMQRVK